MAAMMQTTSVVVPRSSECRFLQANIGAVFIDVYKFDSLQSVSKTCFIVSGLDARVNTHARPYTI
jgi:hypothetical protein